MAYTVTLKDTHTNRTCKSQHRGEWDDYLWDEGNFSCDCNRSAFFAQASGDPEPDEWICGEERYEIVRVELADGRVIEY